MKNINNQELEEIIKKLINGEVTRKGLAKDLDTDLRTLHKEILRLSIINPELYAEYIKKFPYQPKVRDDIDYEALVIELLKRSAKFTRYVFKIPYFCKNNYKKNKRNAKNKSGFSGYI